jgi:iron complex transport system substrate-binding protein
MHRLTIWGLLLMSLAVGAEAAVEVVDDMGTPLVLNRPAQRIVSLSPGATEMLFAAGAGSRIVATVNGADFPDAARQIERIGDVNALKFERLQALKPDVVVYWKNLTHELVVESLKKIKLPLYEVSVRELQDIPRSIERLGALAGTSATADGVARALDTRVRALPRRPTEPSGPRVFYMIWDVPLYTVGSRNAMSDAIARCGGQSIFDDIDFPAPIVEFEEIKKRNPDLIIMAAPPITSRDWRERWNRFPAVSAVANRRISHFTDSRLTRMGPSAIDAVDELCKHMAPFLAGVDR